MMPAMLAQYFAGAQPGPNQQRSESKCPECHNPIPAQSKFCPDCGHQLLIFEQCSHCSKNLTPTAKFCPRCGHAVAKKPEKKFCPNCGNENLADSVFCNECGEKLGWCFLLPGTVRIVYILIRLYRKTRVKHYQPRSARRAQRGILISLYSAFVIFVFFVVNWSI